MYVPKPVVDAIAICAEPDTTDIPLKNEPECIVVPANPEIICADPETVPDGNCAEPENTPVPDKIVAADILPPNEVNVPAIVIELFCNFAFVTVPSIN